MHLTQYEIEVTLQNIEDSDGYLEYHECGYPIYYAYNIVPHNGESEQEYFEPIDIVTKSISLWKSLEICPCCQKTLETRINGEYTDTSDIKEDVSKLIQNYCSGGDSVDFKVLLEQIGVRLGVI